MGNQPQSTDGAVTDPVELVTIGATCRAPSDEATTFAEGDLLIFADWLEARGRPKMRPGSARPTSSSPPPRGDGIGWPRGFEPARAG